MTLADLLASTPEGRRAVATAKLRGDVLETLHDALADAGMTRAALAKKLGRGKSAITNALTGDGNLRVNTIAEYLDAMDMDLEITAKRRGPAPAAETVHVEEASAVEALKAWAAVEPVAEASVAEFWADVPDVVESADPVPVERHLRVVRHADYSVAA